MNNWDRGGAPFLPTFYLLSSTIKLNGIISAGSLGRSLLNISANSVQRVRNRDCRSSSPERSLRERMSVSDNVVDHDASMRNVWATVGSPNWETRGGPFGMLLEGS